MGLFDTKYCTICGNKVGLLGTTKLDDGHLCKECTAKLSPYISHRHLTADSVRKHLSYREANEKELAALNITASYGDSQKIWIDEAKRRFVISRRSDFSKTNPDIFSFDDVVSIEKVLTEKEEEQFTKDSEGKSVSYDPPKFKYTTGYDIKMTVRNQNIANDIRIDLFSDKTSSVFHDEDFFKYNSLTNEAVNMIRPGTIGEEMFVQELPQPAPLTGRYICYIRCANCGQLTEGQAIPRYCPECGDPITLADIGVIDTETGDILV